MSKTKQTEEKKILRYKKEETVGFAGILDNETRIGKFVKKINDYLVEIDYGDHTEHNHISNIFKLKET